MADIFLSYNSRDRARARLLAEALTACGWTVWWDHEVPAGHSWRDLIAEQLDAMRCMVVLWSAQSVDSDWVCEEADEGRLKGCLVPVLIEPVRPPAGFRGIQAADLSGWEGDPQEAPFRRLVADIARKIGAAPHPPADPRPPSPPDPRPTPPWPTLALGVGVIGAAVLVWRLMPASPGPESSAPSAAVPASAPASAGPAQASKPPAGASTVVSADPPARAVRPVAPRPAAQPQDGARCSRLLERASLEGGLSDADRRFLQQECSR